MFPNEGFAWVGIVVDCAVENARSDGALEETATVVMEIFLCHTIEIDAIEVDGVKSIP